MNRIRALVLHEHAAGPAMALVLLIAQVSQATAENLVNGDKVAGVIASVGEQDSYTYLTNAGESVELRVAKLGHADFHPRISLYDPTGTLVRNAQGATVAALSHTASMAGSYTVAIADGSDRRDQTDSYNLYFVRAPGANEGGALINGEVIAELIDVGDLDAYSFTATTGDEVRIRATDLTGQGFVARVALYGPSGTPVGFDAGPALAGIRFRPKLRGTYTVVVADGSAGNAQAGAYRIQLERSGIRLSYAALGDSYSSGEGVYPYFDTTDRLSGCHRAVEAYPLRIVVPGDPVPLAARRDVQFDFLACSGAEVPNLAATGDTRYGERPQLAPANGIDASRDLITLTIGGNDAQFVSIISLCLLHESCDTLKPFAPYLDLTLSELLPGWLALVKARLLNVYSELRHDTPNASTLILDYPMLLAGSECSAAQLPFFSNLKLSLAEQTFLRDANRQLNTAVKEAAATIGLHFVEVADHFRKHEVCGSLENWINGIVLDNPKASFHPTARGQREYARVVNNYLYTNRNGWTYGYFASGLPHNPPPLAMARPPAASAQRSAPQFGELEVRSSGVATTCTTARNAVVPGRPARAQAQGFAAADSVLLSLKTQTESIALGTALADAQGRLDADVDIPETVAPRGVATLEALAAGPQGLGRLAIALLRIQDPKTDPGCYFSN